MLIFLLRQVLILLVLLVLGYIVYNKSRKKFFTCLMYHSVYKVGIPGIISTEEFEEQMKVIKDKKTFKMEELKGLGYKIQFWLRLMMDIRIIMLRRFQF